MIPERREPADRERERVQVEPAHLQRRNVAGPSAVRQRRPARISPRSTSTTVSPTDARSRSSNDVTSSATGSAAAPTSAGSSAARELGQRAAIRVAPADDESRGPGSGRRSRSSRTARAARRSQRRARRRRRRRAAPARIVRAARGARARDDGQVIPLRLAEQREARAGSGDAQRHRLPPSRSRRRLRRPRRTRSRRPRRTAAGRRSPLPRRARSPWSASLAGHSSLEPGGSAVGFGPPPCGGATSTVPITSRGSASPHDAAARWVITASRCLNGSALIIGLGSSVPGSSPGTTEGRHGWAAAAFRRRGAWRSSRPP